jgi:hypothetical protein
MSTPDYTRDSFQEGQTYAEVVFQRNKDILDSELNELQRIMRVTTYRGLRIAVGDTGGANGIGFAVQANGVANQLTVKAGLYLFIGYAIEMLTDYTITGLSTPGGNRTDTVYLKLTEQWIDDSTDASIAAAPLGQTTQRKQVVVTLGVNENSTTTPDDGSGKLPWNSGVIRAAQIATLYRTTGVATITSSQIVDRRIQLAGALAARDRNTFWTSTLLKWDGTTLTITGLQVRTLDQGGSSSVFISGNTTVTPADGDGIGWVGTSTSLYRRQLTGTGTTDLQATEGATSSPITNAPLWSMAMNDNVMLLGARVGNNILLRGGEILRSGDRLGNWGAAPSYVNPTATEFGPTLRFLDASGNVRGLFDHNGYPTGRRTELREEWVGGTSTSAVNIASITSINCWTGGGVSWAGGSNHTNVITAGNAQIVHTAASSDATLGSGYLDLLNDTHNGAGDCSWVTSVFPVVYITDNIVLVAEWEAYTSFSAGINEIVSVGFFSNAGLGSNLPANTTSSSGARGWAIFQSDNRSAAGAWSSRFGNDLASVDTASGLSPVANTYNRFRIELHGKSTALGVALGATSVVGVFYINETQVYRNFVASNFPAGSLFFAWSIYNWAGVASQQTMRMGPILITYSRMLSVPNL